MDSNVTNPELSQAQHDVSFQTIQPSSHRKQIILISLVITILITLLAIVGIYVARRNALIDEALQIATPSIPVSNLINTGVACTSDIDCKDLPCGAAGWCPKYFCQSGYCYEDDSNKPTPMESTNPENKYIDENVQFILKYPLNWSVSTPHVGSYPEKTWMVEFAPQVNTGALIVITTRPVDSTYPSVDKWIASTYAQSYQKTTENTPRYVDNLQAIRLEDTEGNIATFFNTVDTLYSITLFNGSIHGGYSGSNSDVQTERIVYEDILKSFKVGTKPPTIPTLIPVTRAPYNDATLN